MKVCHRALAELLYKDRVTYFHAFLKTILVLKFKYSDLLLLLQPTVTISVTDFTNPGNLSIAMLSEVITTVN